MKCFCRSDNGRIAIERPTGLGTYDYQCDNCHRYYRDGLVSKDQRIAFALKQIRGQTIVQPRFYGGATLRRSRQVRRAESFGAESDRDDTEYLEAMQGIITNFEDSFCPSCSWGLDKHTIVNFNGMPFAYCEMGDNPYMNAESFGAEMDGKKLIASSYDLADGSMMVGVGTETLDVDDPDFMEMMIDEDGKIKYFTLPIGLDKWERSYRIKPTHYGKMKTQNETNEAVGGDFIRTDGEGKYAESFASYDMPISERQRYRIRKLGGRIDKAMNRSDASRYIKSLMAVPLHAETADCPTCQGWGWNEELDIVCDADGCIGGWFIPKKPSLFQRGLESGLGIGAGIAGVALVMGLLGGSAGFAYEEMTKRRD